MPRPPLRTPRLDLLPLTIEHAEHLVALDADPEVMRYLDRPRTRDEVLGERMRQRTDPRLDAAGLGYWSGFLRSDGSFVGWWLLTPRDRREEGDWDGSPVDVAELGYRLRRAAWGLGLATEGSEAVLRHGFETLGLVGVVAETMAVNLGSRGVMHRLGLRHISTEVREWDDPLPGWEEGEVVYALTAREWRSRHPSGA